MSSAWQADEEVPRNHSRRSSGRLCVWAVLLALACATPLYVAESDYRPRGVPDWQRAWTSQDLATAVQALGSLAQTDAAQLPRYRDARSGALFARITAPENLAACQDAADPLSDRMQNCLEVCGATSALLKPYVALTSSATTTNPGPFLAVADEIVEIGAVALRCAAVQLPIMRELIKTFDTEDRKFPVRAAGLDGARHGAWLQGVGSLVLLREIGERRAQTSRRFVGYMLETFPLIAPELPDDLRSSLEGEVRKTAADPAQAYLRDELARLEQRVQGAVRSSPGRALTAKEFDRLGVRMHRQEAGQADPDGWYRADSTEGAFSVRVHAPFSDYSVRSAHTWEAINLGVFAHTYGCPPCRVLIPHSERDAIHVISAETPLGLHFMAIEVQLADGAVELGAQMAEIARTLSGLGGPLQRHRVQLAGRTAEEIRVTTPQFGTVFRFLSDGTRFYQVAVDYPMLSEPMLGRDIEQFFDSFRIEEPRSRRSAAADPAPQRRSAKSKVAVSSFSNR